MFAAAQFARSRGVAGLGQAAAWLNGLLVSPDAGITWQQQLQFNLQLGEVTENGDTATAKVSGTFSVTVDMFGVSESHTENIDESFRLVVEDGEWKVC